MYAPTETSDVKHGFRKGIARRLTPDTWGNIVQNLAILADVCDYIIDTILWKLTKLFLPVWDNWSLWSSCSRNCGGGYAERMRNCSTVACKGLNSERRPCNTESCYQPNSPCSDTSTACFTIDPSQCSYSFYTTVCKRTCGTCNSTPVPVYQCQDNDPRCPSVAAAGECSDPQVSTLCPLSCNLCQSVPHARAPCKDNSMECPSYAVAGQCTLPKVAAVCAKSCGICSATPQCVDQSPKCATFAQQGLCELDPANAVYCQRSCGICGNQLKIGNIRFHCIE